MPVTNEASGEARKTTQLATYAQRVGMKRNEGQTPGEERAADELIQQKPWNSEPYVGINSAPKISTFVASHKVVFQNDIKQ